ncbi:hypothetical protein MRX96_030966 [Rhipicephalus microplus]
MPLRCVCAPTVAALPVQASFTATCTVHGLEPFFPPTTPQFVNQTRLRPDLVPVGRSRYSLHSLSAAPPSRFAVRGCRDSCEIRTGALEKQHLTTQPPSSTGLSGKTTDSEP